MPIRFSSPAPKHVKEFVEPDASDAFIWFLFKHRCVYCRKPATEINEIVPRSRSKQSIQDWENRVLMCRECHNDYHRHGVNSGTIEDLQQKRVEFLKSMGREKYVNYHVLEKTPEPIGKFIESELAIGINLLMPDGLDFVMVETE